MPGEVDDLRMLDEVVSQWGDPDLETHYERVREKFKNFPEEVPDEMDNIDVSCWVEATGGICEGRIWGWALILRLRRAGVGSTRHTRLREEVEKTYLINIVELNDLLDEHGVGQEKIRVAMRRVERRRKGKAKAGTSRILEVDDDEPGMD